MNTRNGFVAALVLIAGVQVAHAIGSSYGKGDPQRPQWNPQWPTGVKELVNREDRIGGSWMNGFDWYDFAGNTAALNGFLEQYAQLHDTPLTLVIHPGKALMSDLSGQKGQSYDWEVGVVNNNWAKRDNAWSREAARTKTLPKTAYTVTVNVYLGGQVDLGELKVPDNVKVESGGEIERFVAQHHAK